MSNPMINQAGMAVQAPARTDRPQSPFLLAFFGVLSLALLLPSVAAAGKLDSAKKSANTFFKGRSFTARVDLKQQGKHDVDPDGQPTSGKDQGRHRKDRGMFVKDVAFAVGTGGKGIYIKADERKGKINVHLTPKRGPGMRFTDIYIHYDRPLVEDDLDPRTIARAVAPYVEFEGVAVGQEIADALSSIEPADAPSATTPAAPSPSANPTLVTLTALATPEVPRRGEDVLLDLTFEVSSPNGQGVEVTERRTLTANGTVLPGYPVTNVEVRPAGRHTSTYRQPIPPTAAAGTYEFRGEACVGGDCISRTVTFQIDP